MHFRDAPPHARPYGHGASQHELLTTELDAPYHLQRGLPSQNWDWDFLCNRSLLTHLTLRNIGIDGPLPSSCTNDLIELTVPGNQLSEIPPNFFLNSPMLDAVYASNNHLSGTIPTQGVRIRHLDLSNNRLTHWADPDVDSGDLSLLAHLNLGNNQLEQIPSPASFANMTALRYLYLSHNPLLGLNNPLPFDITRTHSVIHYYITNCAVTGPLPEMQSKLAETRDANTQRYWQFGQNNFEGPIPTSWYNYTWSGLVLDNNVGINGAFPGELFQPARLDPNGATLLRLDLSGTSKEGPMNLDLAGKYNKSFYAPLATIVMSNMANVDFCDENIDFVPWNATNRLFACDLRGTNASSCPEKYTWCSLTPLVVPEPPNTPTPTPAPTSTPFLRSRHVLRFR